MGMGEPLLNADRESWPRLRRSPMPRRFGLGARHMTISTSGVLPGLERLLDAGAAVHLGRLAARGPTRPARRAGAA